MDYRTLTALKASIEKWERNARAETPEAVTTGPSKCPLCKLFWHINCEGCPVAVAVDATCCERTPYIKAEALHYFWSIGDVTADAFRKAAQAEVDFLKSLLPDGEIP